MFSTKIKRFKIKFITAFQTIPVFHGHNLESEGGGGDAPSPRLYRQILKSIIFYGRRPAESP